MRTLSSPTSTGVALPITSPGYFVEILFAVPFRASSRGTLAWAGNSWQAWDIKVSGLAADAAQSGQSGSITLGNTDFAIGVQVLNEGVADRVVNVWKFYGDAPATGDPVQIFSGVASDVSAEAKRTAITINLVQSGGQTSFIPRRYITREQGFSILPADGLAIAWNNEVFTLRRQNV